MTPVYDFSGSSLNGQERTIAIGEDYEGISGWQLRVPKQVSIHDGSIRYVFDKHDRTYVQPNKHLLSEFVETIGGPERIVRFARRFGPLGLCKKHGRPVTHKHGPWCALSLKEISLDDGKAEIVVREDAEAWLRKAKIAHALVNICGQLNKHRVPDVALFKALPGWVGQEVPTRMQAWRDVGIVVNRWLSMCRFEYEFGFQEPRRKLKLVQIGIPALFAQIGLQLAFASSGTRPSAVCSYCGNMYRPEKKPNPNRDNYCLKCRRAGIPLRMAKRRQRAPVV